jgi:polysaccharide export outer membrane protein
MKKNLLQIVALVTLILGITSCKAPEDIIYLQDVQNEQRLEGAELSMIRIRPGDQLSIVVSSRNPELSTIFNLAVPYRYVGNTSFSSGGSNSQTAYFTVASDGTIDYPMFGSLQVSGLTRQELSKKIKDMIIDGDYIKDPIVTVDYANLTISVLGEVTNPGKYNIAKDRMTILDAISMARDLTINGVRDDVLVLRENIDGSTETYRVDLTNSKIMQSPVYYLQQNDVIYVSPNEQRRRQSRATGNTIMTPTFWLSITSTICTVATLIYTLSK